MSILTLEQRIIRRQRLDELGYREYTDYLDSLWWKERRRAIKILRGWRCEDCGSRYRLEVDHLDYCDLGREKDHQLRVRCHRCHGKRHKIQQKRMSRKPRTGVMVWVLGR